MAEFGNMTRCPGVPARRLGGTSCFAVSGGGRQKALVDSQARAKGNGIGTRYDATGRILPGLIRGVETVARTTGTASPAACAVRARVYDIAGCGCLEEDLVEVPLQELPTGPVDPVLRQVDDLTLFGVEPDEKTAPHPW